MSDQMTPEVREWMKRTEVPPPDSRLSAREVMDRLPTVRRRKRWWPFPVFYQKPQSPPSPSGRSEYQPGPILATDGHIPTVTWRTQTMFSPAKAIIAGALVFAIGGALLIAQPFEQQGSDLPGAEAFEDYAPAAAIDGQIFWKGDCGTTPQTFDVGDAIHTRDFAYCAQTLVNDERLNGETRMDGAWDDWPDGAGVVRGTFSITNDEGTWEGPLAGVSRNATQDDWDAILLLTGTGAYDGLSATLFFGSSATVQGTLYDSRLEPDQ